MLVQGVKVEKGGGGGSFLRWLNVVGLSGGSTAGLWSSVRSCLKEFCDVL